MSHPFTLEYMQDGKTNASGPIGGDIQRPKGDQKGEQEHESPMMSSQSTRICEGQPASEGCQTNQVEENPDGEMEMTREEVNITINDKDRLTYIKILRMAIRRRLEVFAGEVSIMGMSYLVKPSTSTYKIGSFFRKVVWTILLLFGTGFMVYQIYDCISNYLTYPTIVNYRVAYNQSLRFPTVTICSVIMGSKKALLSMGN